MQDMHDSVVKSYLCRETHNRILMDWPPHSPNVNITEAVPDHLDREWNKTNSLSQKVDSVDVTFSMEETVRHSSK